MTWLALTLGSDVVAATNVITMHKNSHRPAVIQQPNRNLDVNNYAPFEATSLTSDSKNPLYSNTAPIQVLALFRSYGSAMHTRSTDQGAIYFQFVNPSVRHSQVRGTELQNSHVEYVRKPMHVHQYFKGLKFTAAFVQ